MFKVNNKDTRIMSMNNVTPSSTISIADFEQYMLAGQQEFYSI